MGAREPGLRRCAGCSGGREDGAKRRPQRGVPPRGPTPPRRSRGSKPEKELRSESHVARAGGDIMCGVIGPQEASTLSLPRSWGIGPASRAFMWAVLAVGCASAVLLPLLVVTLSWPDGDWR